ncbi:hypothetical protein SVEN_0590 [Streptomyces venezuelae ATCC 10712]|uniref:Integral membrane protein n=2 Tax=Streptomyces TaxID=1883 RepID=F2R8F9_STRVP|nr:hypothetical protein SVEN_0590 [Streptomyces venezuelae ATCC 10712]
MFLEAPGTRTLSNPYGREPIMGLGIFIIMIAVGAILTFASDWELEAVNLDVVGLILMGVGIFGTAVYTSVLRRRRMVVPPVAPTVTDDDRRDLL